MDSDNGPGRVIRSRNAMEDDHASSSFRRRRGDDNYDGDTRPRERQRESHDRSRPIRNRDRDRDRDRYYDSRRDYDRDDRSRGDSYYKDSRQDDYYDRGHSSRSSRSSYRRSSGRDLSRSPRRSHRTERASPSPSSSRHQYGRGGGDFESVVPINERQRRMTMWDIRAPGYEQISAEQAKISGLFPLPGSQRLVQQQQQQQHNQGQFNNFNAGRPMNGLQQHPQQQQQHQQRGEGFQNNNRRQQDLVSQVSRDILLPSHSRLTKWVVISGFDPESTSQADLQSFYNKFLSSVKMPQPKAPIQANDAGNNSEEPSLVPSTNLVSLQLTPDIPGTALLQVESSEAATLLVAFDGLLEFQGHHLSIRRPHEYIAPQVISKQPESDKPVIGAWIPDSTNKISISHIPPYITEEDVLELLNPFGKLCGFTLIKDKVSNESLGVGFAEFVDTQDNEVAVEGLNDMELGDSKLVVRKACIGQPDKSSQIMANAITALQGLAQIASTTPGQEPTSIIQLLNVADSEDLANPEEYNEIINDIREECEKIGQVVGVKIPRPPPTTTTSSNNTNDQHKVLTPALGTAYVRFKTVQDSVKAVEHLSGRRFADRTLVTAFFPEESYELGAF